MTPPGWTPYKPEKWPVDPEFEELYRKVMEEEECERKKELPQKK